MASAMTVALAGNPNTGKTTVFNNLTGSRQHVGNWPGVTVEKKWGRCRHRGIEIDVVDLPGVYSLTAYSPDELIARRFVLDENPDVVVDVVDASNLERNLYLTTQLMELGARLVVALNMSDVAEARKYRIDVQKLSELLGVPVVRTVASRNEGTAELLDRVVELAQSRPWTREFRISYGSDIETEIHALEALIVEAGISWGYPPRWLAVKLLEGDEDVIRRFGEAQKVG